MERINSRLDANQHEINNNEYFIALVHDEEDHD